MSKICILTADKQLYDLTALLLEMHGHSAATSAGDYPMVWDADSASLPRLTHAQAVIAISRTPGHIPDSAARRCCVTLGRPFEFECFTAAVEKALSWQGEQVSPPSRGQRQAITLDRPRRRLVCGHKSVTLTPAELAIFTALYEQRGQAVSRTVLEQALQGESLPVHMCSLRKKLSALTRLPLITTVRGQGYKFE